MYPYIFHVPSYGIVPNAMHMHYYAVLVMIMHELIFQQLAYLIAKGYKYITYVNNIGNAYGFGKPHKKAGRA